MLGSDFDIDRYWDRYDGEAKDLDCMASMIGFKYHILFNKYLYVYGFEGNNKGAIKRYIIDKNGELVYEGIRFIAPLLDSKDLESYNKQIEDKALKLGCRESDELQEYGNKLRSNLIKYYAIFTKDMKSYENPAEDPYSCLEIYEKLAYYNNDNFVDILTSEGDIITRRIVVKGFRYGSKPSANTCLIDFPDKNYNAYFSTMTKLSDSPVKYFLSTR